MRKRVVSRTIAVNEVTALVVKGDDTVDEVFEIGGNFRSNKQLITALNKICDDGEVVYVRDVKRVEKKYAMDEADFIAHATEVKEGGEE